MTIDEAIEDLGALQVLCTAHGATDLIPSTKLGIEALNREKANRDNPDFVMVGKLPGETKE